MGKVNWWKWRSEKEEGMERRRGVNSFFFDNQGARELHQSIQDRELNPHRSIAVIHPTAGAVGYENVLLDSRTCLAPWVSSAMLVHD